MSHDTVILKIIGGTLHEMRGGGDLVIPRGMERISDSGYLSLDMMPPCIDSITVEDGSPSFYAKNNCLIRKEDGELVLGCRNSVIPDDGSVRSIGAFAFNGLALRELTIPTSVEHIGCCAFTEQEVRRLILPEGLRCVEPLAFMTVTDDDAEMELYIPSTLEEIGYDWLSLSEKIRAGMEVSELMKRLTGRNYPQFVDNMESVDDLANVRPTGQVIMAKCVSKAELSVRPVKPILTAMPTAA